MKRVVAVALLVLVALPTAHAKPEYDYPDDIVGLLPKWTAEVEALAQPADHERPWWPQAEGFLVKAKEARDAGRVRVAMFHLETFAELVTAHHLMDEAEAFGADAEKRSFVLQRTNDARSDAERAWTAYRERLHRYDGEVKSLHTIEKALYSADLALGAIVSTDAFDALARQFPHEEGFPEGYVVALARATTTPLLDIGWAEDILAEAVKAEGLPPRVVDEPWNNLTMAVVAYRANSTEVPFYARSLDARAKPAREANESLLALAAVIAEQRSARADGMQTIFGDANSRGMDVVRDSSRGMGKLLDNTTLDTPRSYGMLGVFTSDAIDRALLTTDYVAEGKADLNVVIAAWVSLEHQTYVLGALGKVSPIQPPAPVEEEKGAPGAGLLIASLALAGAAYVTRPRK